jgi:acyl carrier protein
VTEKAKGIINSIIANEIGCSAEELEPETHFYNDLGSDSLDFVEIVMEIEKEFNISIPDKELDEVNTVGELYGVCVKYFDN